MDNFEKSIPCIKQAKSFDALGICFGESRP
jgi:hypothetical protein